MIELLVVGKAILQFAMYLGKHQIRNITHTPLKKIGPEGYHKGYRITKLILIDPLVLLTDLHSCNIGA